MKLSLVQARSIILAAQGYAQPRPPKPRPEHLQEIIRRLGVLQLDFVNVLLPAHYLVLFSRLGPYPLHLFEQALYPDDARFTEAWAHEASLIPIEIWPLLSHRRSTHRVRPWGFESFLAAHASYAQWVVDQVRQRGPLAAADVPAPPGVPGKIEHSWYGSTARATLEAHFGRGVLAVRNRKPNMARVFDLSERLIPEVYHALSLPQDEARRNLLQQAAKALGVATAADLSDYFRMPVGEVRPLIEELASNGELQRVQVEGWPQQAYLPVGTTPAATVEPTAILSPFDPLVWYRPRTQRLFGFDYRLEIFVPAGQRRWGYYVLPFLFRGRLAARVDLKADRPQGSLRVLASFLEQGFEPGAVAEALAAELVLLAEWLGLGSVRVARKGNLARHLAGRFPKAD